MQKTDISLTSTVRAIRPLSFQVPHAYAGWYVLDDSESLWPCAERRASDKCRTLRLNHVEHDTEDTTSVSTACSAQATDR